MTSENACAHTEMQIGTAVNPILEQGRFLLSMRVCCQACNQEFRFVPPAETNETANEIHLMIEPSISAEGEIQQ